MKVELVKDVNGVGHDLVRRYLFVESRPESLRVIWGYAPFARVWMIWHEARRGRT
jgi:hypothetical protein